MTHYVDMYGWNNREDEVLTDLTREGLDRQSIAVKMGRSTHSVRRRQLALQLDYKRASRWSERLDEVLRNLVRSGLKPKSVSEKMAIPLSSIKARMRSLGLYACYSDTHGDPIGRSDNEPVSTRAQDEAFQEAMRAAIQAGLERMPQVIADNSVVIPKRFYAAERSSGCGSAASQCAEAGGGAGWYR